MITQIGWDHQKVLGNTIAAIAAEKAGIIKPGVPALTSATDPEAKAIIEWKARELDSLLLTIGPGELANFRLEVGLLGEHQRSNGALAAATVRLLRAFLPVSDAQLAEGFRNLNWLLPNIQELNSRAFLLSFFPLLVLGSPLLF